MELNLPVKYFKPFFMLSASIAIAVFGLVIGLICRKDLFGVKTKLCRTQRREPPTIPEQVPLNKV